MSSDKEASFIMRLVDMVSGPMKSISGVATSTTSKIAGLIGTTGGMAGKAFAYNQLSQAIQSVGQELESAIAPGRRFNAGLGELESVTGIKGKELAELGMAAREQAKIFGGEAADAVGVYNGLINRLGPDVASNGQALGAMGTDVMVLSKLMKNDAVGATEALSTSLLQFGVNLKDPIESARKMHEYTNIMAAGMNNGSMDVGKVSQALEQSGSSAVKAGLNFAQTNALIQTIAKSGKMGSEAGVGLRNVLLKLAGTDILPKEAVQKLKALGVDMKLVSDPTKDFSLRLKELKKIQGDATLTAQMFGTENVVVADTLLNNIGYYDDLVPKLNDHNAAINAAKPIMDTYDEKMSRAGARLKDWGISLFDATKNYLPFIQGTVGALDTTARLGPAFDVVKSGAGGLVNAFRVGEGGAKGFGLQLLSMGWNAMKAGAGLVFTGISAVGSFVVGMVSATAAQYGLNLAMLANPIGLFIVGLVAVGAAVAVVIAYWDELKAAFSEVLGDEFIKWVDKVWDKITGFFKGIKGFFKGVFGDTISIPKNPYEGLGPTKDPNAAGANAASAALAKQNKGTEIEGDKSKSRIVSIRIDKVEANIHASGAPERSLDELGKQVASILVGSVRDAEIILSNG